MEGISIADALALTGSREHEGFSFGGVGGLILILLFFIIFGGAWGNSWGGRGESQAISDLERDVLNGNCTTQKAVLESNYSTLMGFKDAQYQMSSCCCDLKTAIHAEGEATRALIQNNTIQELRDRLDTANNALTVQTITNQIVQQLQPVAKPAYITCSPYFAYPYGYFNGGSCGSCGNI